MKEKTMVICDDDKAFIDRLGRYFSMREELKINVACFSDRGMLAEYAKQNRVDVFLAGEGWVDDSVCEDSRRWLLLSDGNETEAEDMGKYRRVRRYQAADDLLKTVLQYMELPGTGETHGQRTASRIGIYTPAGWPESTVLSLAVASRLGKEGPVVYIGLNEFSPAIRLAEKCKGYDLSDVAYSWRRGRLNYGQLERMTGHADGFDVIPAPVNPAELAELSGKEAEELLEYICVVGGYLYVVIDFGGSISGRHTLFENCARNLVIFPDTQAGLYQQEEFERFWRSVGGERLLEKTDNVVLPVEELVESRKRKGEEYMNELAERLLQTGRTDDTKGGIIVC